MKFPVNQTFFGRQLRALAAEVLALVAFFWLPAPWSYLSYAAALWLALEAWSGHCLLNRLFLKHGVLGGELRRPHRDIVIFAVMTAVFAVAAPMSVFWSQRLLVDDLGRLQVAYDQAVAATDRRLRVESQDAAVRLEIVLDDFYRRYRSYRPFAIKTDRQLGVELAQFAELGRPIKFEAVQGDLGQARRLLSGPVDFVGGIMARNRLSALSLALVVFKEAGLVTLLDAAERGDSAQLIRQYDNLNARWGAVEALATGPEFAAVRAAIEALMDAARLNQTEKLLPLAKSLRAAFGKAYFFRD
ncbi:hypothetical protein A3C96_04185 [Candidatus Uhrbacteria bacterium RIFCSPHIGHO2_02_FULL_60_10]|uniref:DUF2892 domain-containing protein n=1 Tax=Candidatus Uhrbacteria bacterium RIFCSPHIGHO2_02_FULL_60_10 TaxID=1802392 RepID=A0A1F7U795_9BACT|nr:MAG: hypothetical protein A3C96_04185 [Candidatus Uhrbacteria bacterium RIFCSPHIGHO2_02_FULL_60_10]